MILIDDESLVCNDCVLDDEALDRSKSVCKLVRITSWFLIMPKRVTAIVYRYIQEGMYSTAIRESIVGLITRIRGVSILEAIFGAKSIFARREDRVDRGHREKSFLFLPFPYRFHVEFV